MNESQKIQDGDRSSASFDYGRLRSWYLARLRQRIIKQIESGYLTPSSLIAADRRAVQNLILSGIYSGAKPDLYSGSNGFNRLPFEWCLVFFLALQLALLVLVSFGTLDFAGLRTFCLISLVVSVIFSLLLWIIYRNNVRGRIRAFASELMKLEGVPKPSAQLDELSNLERTCCALAESMSEAIEREYAIADYALEFISAIDDSGDVVAFSPSFAEFIGYRAHDLINQPFIKLVAGEDVERTSTFLHAVQSSQTTVPFENQLRRKDSSLANVHWLTEWSEKDRVLFCVGRDVSDQKRLERVRNEFVSMVGHDLRTPLTSLGCTLELLSGNDYGELSQKGRALLDGAVESNSRLLALINQLLDLESIEAGKLPLCNQETTISSLLKSAVESVESFAAKQGVKILVHQSEIKATIDKDRLMQVLVNLLSNAIKFSPPGGKIAIAVTSEKRRLQVKITDEGPGISAKHHDLIFQRFKQVHGEKEKDGSGLGLSICKAIIDAYGGTIGVDSTPGRGSTFWFTIPLES